MDMLRTEWAFVGFVAATVTVLLTGTAFADDAVESRAERICTGIGQTGPSVQAAFSVDDLSIQTDANGTVILMKDGVKLGEIAHSSYIDHTVCFVEVMALISSKS
jgi:hypothetical protein